MLQKITHTDEDLVSLIKTLDTLEDPKISDDVRNEVIKTADETLLGAIKHLEQCSGTPGLLAPLTSDNIDSMSPISWYMLIYHFVGNRLDSEKSLPLVIVSAINEFINENPDMTKSYIDAPLIKTDIANIFHETQFDTYAALAGLDILLAQLESNSNEAEKSKPSEKA